MAIAKLFNPEIRAQTADTNNFSEFSASDIEPDIETDFVYSWTSISPSGYTYGHAWSIRGTESITYTLATAEADGWFTWFMMTDIAVAANRPALQLRNSTVVKAELRTTNDAFHLPELYIAGSLVGTGTTEIGTTEKRWSIGFDVGLATAAGALYVEGIQEVGSGGSFVNGGSGSTTIDDINFISPGNGARHTRYGAWLLDDDKAATSYRNSLHIPHAIVNANASTGTAWVPSSAANVYQDASDFDLTTWGESASDPDTLRLEYDDMAADIGLTGVSIIAVQPYAIVKQEGAIATADVGVFRGGAQVFTTKALTSTFDYTWHVALVDPTTTIAWTVSNWDAAQSYLSIRS